MLKANRYNEQFHVGDDGSSPDSVSTLVPMLVGGLGLIVAGMIAVGIFVGESQSTYSFSAGCARQ